MASPSDPNAADRSQDRIATTVHELQTPLTAMLLTLHLLERTGERLKDAELQTRVAAVTRQAEELSRMITRLLDAP